MFCKSCGLTKITSSSSSSSPSSCLKSSSSPSPETLLARCDETLSKLRTPLIDGLIDDWIVGNRVWVDGNKPGYIQFIGEVHFADGDWAGVVLDEPIGKNAGSVGGRRYFYCEPKRGLFCRLNRLSHYPYSFGKATPDSGIDDPVGLRRFKTLSLSDSPSRLSGRSLSRSPDSRGTSLSRTESPVRYRSLSPVRRSEYETISSKTYSYTLPRKPAATYTTVSTTTTTIDGQYKPGPLRLGDKVFVNSTRGVLTGRLRFLGTTHFAPGQWAGIELDEPYGKNDGQVAGKRYFTCRSRYGLFTPVYKVVKADPNRMTTVTRSSRNGPRF